MGGFVFHYSCCAETQKVSIKKAKKKTKESDKAEKNLCRISSVALTISRENSTINISKVPWNEVEIDTGNTTDSQY